MVQCCGITNKSQRCSNKARHIQVISGADFHVCKHHQKINLLAKWDKDIVARKVSMNKVPTTIRSWLTNFYDAWENTHNLTVSAKFASSTFNRTAHTNPFHMKYEMYINSLVKETQGECSVCYGDGNVKETSCGHTLCLSCLGEWMHRSVTCPVYRTIL